MKKLVLVFASLIFGFSLFAASLKISDADYQKMMDKSLTSMGNNYRIKKVIEKMRKGEEVYVAALGGSVTEGQGPESFRDGYAYKFNKKMADAFALRREKIYFLNAGLCGTNSPLGLIRYQKDVIEPNKHTPDLLLIEFAVNDVEEPTKQRAFEALIHDALTASPDTAIIVVYSAALYPKTQKVMMPIAEYYGVQQVSPSDAYDLGVAKGYLKQTDYFKDIVHPIATGHEIMADCITNLMIKIDEAPLDAKMEIPAKALKSPDFFGFKAITGNTDDVQIVAGSFTGKDPNTQTLLKNGKPSFPQNWYHSAKSGIDSMHIEVECKNFLLTYKEQGAWLSEKFGKVEIYVDGKKFADKGSTLFDGGKANGWNNCVTLMLIDKPTAEKHSIEIRMAKGFEKKGFTIVTMGYSK